jgi:hypothetical protein
MADGRKCYDTVSLHGLGDPFKFRDRGPACWSLLRLVVSMFPHEFICASSESRMLRSNGGT